MSKNDLDAWFNKVDKAFTRSFRQTRVNVEHSANRDMQSVVTMLFATLNKILESEQQHVRMQTNAALLKKDLERVVEKHNSEESELQEDASKFKTQLETIRNRVNMLVKQIQDDIKEGDDGDAMVASDDDAMTT